MNVFEKIDHVKKIIKSTFGDMSNEEIFIKISHAGRFHLKQRKTELNESEKAVYELLVRNGLNPWTVLRWFRFETYPEEIRNDLKKGYISERQARKEFAKWRDLSDAEIKKEIVKDIQKFIGGLENGI